MRRILVAPMVLSGALAVAVFAGVGPSLAATPSYPTVPSRLYSVAGVSPHDLWAVGIEPNSSLIMHWDGSSWSTSYDQPVGFFYGVRATSADDVWAVGGTNWFSPSKTLAEHWNGQSWSQVATPTPGASAYFESVAATSATNAWAVGLIGPGPGQPSVPKPLIEHWDGHKWSVQSFPEPKGGGVFGSVAALSLTNVWAVGWTGGSSEGTGQTTLTEHWNGHKWSLVPSPNLVRVNGGNFLNSVVALSPDTVWAVGTAFTNGAPEESLTMHWNGHRWTIEPSPNPTGDTNLIRVSMSSPDNVWAVGYTNPTTCNPICGTIAMHWNGRQWKATSTPDPDSSGLNVFEGVLALSRNNVWAVGTTDWAQTLIAHWNGQTWQ